MNPVGRNYSGQLELILPPTIGNNPGRFFTDSSASIYTNVKGYDLTSKGLHFTLMRFAQASEEITRNYCIRELVRFRARSGLGDYLTNRNGIEVFDFLLSVNPQERSILVAGPEEFIEDPDNLSKNSIHLLGRKGYSVEKRIQEKI